MDGIIIVTSPQELVSMIVAKAVNMAKKMDIPIVGIVENMSYLGVLTARSASAYSAKAMWKRWQRNTAYRSLRRFH